MNASRKKQLRQKNAAALRAGSKHAPVTPVSPPTDYPLTLDMKSSDGDTQSDVLIGRSHSTPANVLFRPIATAWAMFSLLLSFLTVISFLHPDWIVTRSEDDDSQHEIFGSVTSRNAKFGIYRRCHGLSEYSEDEFCSGVFDEVSDHVTDSNDYFFSAGICASASLATSVAAIIVALFSFCCKATYVFVTAGILQLFSGLSMASTVTLYMIGYTKGQHGTPDTLNENYSLMGYCQYPDTFPFNPTDSETKKVRCAISWAIALAAIIALCSVILAFAAFSLALRQCSANKVHKNRSSFGFSSVERKFSSRFSSPKFVKNPLADHSSIDKYRTLKSDSYKNEESDNYWVIPEISITTATLTQNSKPFGIRPPLNEVNDVVQGDLGVTNSSDWTQTQSDVMQADTRAVGLSDWMRTETSFNEPDSTTRGGEVTVQVEQF